MTTFRVYALLEPDSDAVRYVGQTKEHLGARLQDHLRPRGISARAEWLRSLLDRGREPRIVLLEVVPGTRRDAYARETYWIRRLRDEGHELVNVP